MVRDIERVGSLLQPDHPEKSSILSSFLIPSGENSFPRNPPRWRHGWTAAPRARAWARAARGKRAAGRSGDAAGQTQGVSCRQGAGGRGAILAGRADPGEAKVAHTIGKISRWPGRGSGSQRVEVEDGALDPVFEERSGPSVLGRWAGDHSRLLFWR